MAARSPFLPKKLIALAIWLLTMGAVLYLWLDVGQRTPILGFAQGPEHKVAPILGGKILSVAVKLGQRVRVGQVLATLDPQVIDAQIGIQQAELLRIKALIGAAGSQHQLRALSTARGFAQANEQARLALVRARAELRVKSAELKVLAAQRRELNLLVKKRVVTRQSVIGLEVRYTAVKNEVASAQAAIRILRAQVLATKARRVALPGRSVQLAVAALEAQLTVIKRKLELLVVQKNGLTLRAPIAGRVAPILMRKGEVARIGRPVVSIVADATTRVIACIYENQATKVAVGLKVTLHERGGKKTLKGHIAALGGSVRQLPARCQAQPRIPVWGRQMVIQLSKSAKLVSGQAFNVRLTGGRVRLAKPKLPAALDGGKPTTKPTRPATRPTPTTTKLTPPTTRPAVPTTPLRGEPEKISIPLAVTRASRFEPSGALWVPRLSRYVLVSDDTGYKHRNDHAPWLFTMDSRGRVDARPLDVSGVRKFNDLESIAPADKNAIYVLSSQSYSKKGRRKRSRQLFCRLTVAGASFHAARCVRLASLLDAAGAPLLSKLGIGGTRYLNIEGMTRGRRGELLLGLKAPLDAEGNALIWRIKDPEALLISRDVAAGLRLFARVKLRVQANGRPVPGGISELLALPDGRLLIAATASGIRSERQSGSLSIAPQMPVAGALPVRHLRSFAGRKPEGLSLSPRHGHVLVVFDAKGARIPAWLEMPWPKKPTSKGRQVP